MVWCDVSVCVPASVPTVTDSLSQVNVVCDGWFLIQVVKLLSR